MTLNEIEKTLQELQERHPNLDEAMLVTLLTAGGWEEKMIRDATAVFRGSKSEPASSQNKMSLPIIEKEKVLPETIDYDHALLEHNLPAGQAGPPTGKTGKEEPKQETETPVIEKEIKTPEPQSLIESTVEEKPVQTKEIEVPHNLSVRPFESTEGVWPFSRYKDVFFGDVMPKSKEEIKEPAPIKVNQVVEKHIVVDNIHIRKTPLSSKDEKLIITASTMLVLVIILLAYMYVNGRL